LREGHYLTDIDPTTRELTTLGMPGFAEQLDVYLDDTTSCGPSMPSGSSACRSWRSTTACTANRPARHRDRGEYREDGAASTKRPR
jgi:hypothetical protein